MISVLRSLWSRPGATLAAVLCLSVGIGTNIALFGVVDALVLRPPEGVSGAAGLVRVRLGGPMGGLRREAGPTASFPQYERIVKQRRAVFAGVAAYGGIGGSLGSGLDARLVSAYAVTGNFFSVLGVRPRLGRFFDVEESDPRIPRPVAVLSYNAWSDLFGGDTHVLGHTIDLDGVRLSIIGVAPKGFVGVDLGGVDLWVPMGAVTLPELGGPGRLGGGSGWLQFIARLRPGLALARARALTAPEPAGDPFTAEPVRPRADGSTEPIVPLTLLPLRSMFFETPDTKSPISVWALAISGAVLLLACATVANLLLAEAVRRRRDTAVRLAIGGSPSRVVREHLARSVLLAALSGVGATVMAWLGIVLVRHLPIPPLPGVVTARSVAVGAAAALLTPLLFGVAPALWAARRPVSEVLKERGGAGIAGVSRLQHGFMAAQTAVGFVLLLVAVLFVRSLANLRAFDTGMDVDRILVVAPPWHHAGEDDSRNRLLRESLDRLRAIPGVEDVAVGGFIPFYEKTTWAFSAEGWSGDDAWAGVVMNKVSAGYFRTMGVDIIRGRGFGEDASGPNPREAVVSAALARARWPGTDPLGACLRIEDPDDACTSVVGVAADVTYDGPLRGPNDVLYVPASRQEDRRFGSRVFVRTSGDPSTVVPAVRRVVQSLDPSMPYIPVAPLSDRVQARFLPWEVGAKLFSAMGVLAALLASVGLYMVVSFIVAQRSRELGVRAALGAGRVQLISLVMAAGLRVSGTGLAVGAGLGAAVAALLRSRFYGLGFLDPGTYLAVAGALAFVTLLASVRPAARASRTDPAIVLRDE